MMKLNRKFKYGILTALLVLVSACSGSNSNAVPTIKVLNLKPEIDEALQAYAKDYSTRNNVDVQVETCGGSNCDYATKLDSYITAGQIPDVFLLEGRGGFEKNKDIVADLSGEEWTKDTDYAFIDNSVVYGFPLGVEGFGMTYNKDILDKAGIDPTTLTSLKAYEDAFKVLDAKKDELGITSPVAMATGSGMYWVTGLHSFNSYLSGELSQQDNSFVTELNSGNIDQSRLNNYADMIELLFNNSDSSVLTAAGDQYATQVKLFTDGKTAFLHQGNWVDGDLATAGLTNVGIAPAPYGANNKTYISAPSYFFVAKDSENIDAAKAFLASIQGTLEGQTFMYTDAKSISPFKSVTITPDSPLAKSIYDKIISEQSSPWNQNDMPSDFGMQKLGPIHEAYAKGEIDKAKFIEQITKEVEALK